MPERFKTPEDALRLGARLRKARKMSNFTLSFVSKKTGVDPGQISKIERGQMLLMSKNVQKICKFLKIRYEIGDVPATRAGRRVDALLAASLISEKAAIKLIAAVENAMLEISGGQ